MPAFISRDPFSRHDVHRYQVRAGQGHGDSCAFCGGLNGNGKLFIYVIVPDSIMQRQQVDPKAFCSIGCRRLYFE